MGYMVEVSFDTRRRSDVTSIQSLIRHLAIDSGGDTGYFVHEIEGKGKTIIEQSCVYTTSFDDDSLQTQLIDNCQRFLNKVSRIDRVYVETVAHIETYQLIYASNKYLKKMGKVFAKKYRENRKTLNISDLERNMLSEIKRK